MSRTLSRAQIIETIGRRLGFERARGGRGLRRRLEGDTGSEALNALHAIGRVLPTHALASAAARSGEEFAQRLRRNFLIGRFLNSAERALQHRGLQPLTDEERGTIIRIGDDAFQGGLDGEGVAQAVSDALNNQGIPTLLSDQSSDDLDAGRQATYDASESGDPDPNASDNLLAGQARNSNRRFNQRNARDRSSSSWPNAILGTRYSQAPGSEPPDDGLRSPRDPEDDIETPDDSLRGRLPQPPPPAVQQPPDDGFGEPVPRPAPPAVEGHPDDGFRDPVLYPAPSTPIRSPSPAIAFAKGMPRPRRRPLIAGSAPMRASDIYGGGGFSR